MRARWFKVRFVMHNGLNFGTLWRFPVLWRGRNAHPLSRLWHAMRTVYRRQGPAAWVSLQRMALELLSLLCAKGQLLPDWQHRVRFHDTFSTLLAHVDAHLADPLPPKALARVLSVSESHLYAVFRRQIGLSPSAFVKQRRIEAACAMLETTSHSVKEIAAQTGFANPYHFSREFRRIHGIPPRTHRRHFVAL
jgi:transcriptional regulator GlxA family with amidase domain